MKSTQGKCAVFNAVVGTTYPKWLDFESVKLFRLAYENGKGKPLWASRKLLTECSPLELSESNQRTLSPNEIILDFESPEATSSGVAKLILERIDFWLYRANRGCHAHIFFERLPSFSADRRKEIRSLFCKRFGADSSKVSDDSMIALENRQHWKSGKLKMLLSKRGIVNSDLPDWSLVKPFTPVLALNANAESIRPPSGLSIQEILSKNPRINDLVLSLQGDSRPDDRSGKDFAISLCLAEQGITMEQAFLFLQNLKHSKVNAIGHGLRYFQSTWQAVQKRLA